MLHDAWRGASVRSRSILGALAATLVFGSGCNDDGTGPAAGGAGAPVVIGAGVSGGGGGGAEIGSGAGTGGAALGAGGLATAGAGREIGGAAMGAGGANGMGGGASASGGSVMGTGGAGGGANGGQRSYSTNRAEFFGDSRCAAANVQFCEDFESGKIDAGTWKVGGAPSVDEAQSARGKKALHVAQNGNGQQRITLSKVFPATNGRYWGRAFVYLNAMPHHSAQADSLDYSHWTILAATGAKVAGEVRIGGQLQKRYGNATPLNFWGVGTDNRTEPEGTGDWTNADDDPKGAAKPVVEKQWSCIEWLGDYMADETKFFLDGVEHPSLATTPQTKHGGNADKPFLLPELNAVWFGWAEYQPTTQEFELWFDEIAIDHERVGCAL